MGMWVTFWAIGTGAGLQVGLVMSVSVGGALDGFLRGSLGGSSVRAERSPKVDDVSGADVVDETCWEEEREKPKEYEPILFRYGRSAQGESRLTVDVNWFEGCVSIGSTTTRRGGGAVLSLFLSDVGGPVLSHHGADDDVEHRVLDVLLDESEESGVVDLGRVNGGLVLVGFSVQDDLWASNANRKKRKNRVRTSENRKIQTRLEGGAPEAGWAHFSRLLTG
jgi:hypothetical protein